MEQLAIRSASGEAAQELYRTRLDDLPKKKNLDKFRGCLIGGAAGDALGYAVEFMREPMIFRRYGERGITEYALTDGVAEISDDTQMTLFTANGLLVGTTRGATRGIRGRDRDYIAQAYLEWYLTQQIRFGSRKKEYNSCWLMNVPELYSPRAPGNTCMSAIENGCVGTIEDPTNHSKGCGGVMRVAPIGLYYGDVTRMPLKVDLLGADAAALTHGHEMGYIPAAMLVHIIRLVCCSDEITLKDAVLDSMEAMKIIFPDAKHLDKFLKLIGRAVELAESDGKDLDAIHELGEGWVGDEALAIAIFCALRYSDDFDKCMIASVNHKGDSDSTGAIAGNILGAYLGLSAIGEKYLQNLELRDVILEIADDLYYDCQISEYTQSTDPRDIAWERKYVFVDYPKV